MSEQGRIVLFNLFVGMNGSGKSHQMKKWLRLNKRNLILPASRADKQWSGIPELLPQMIFVLDPMDPSGKRKRAQWVIPELGSFTGNRVIHIEGSDAQRTGVFNAIVHPQHGYHDGGMFMDDAKNYIRTKGNIPGNVRTFFGNRRLHMVDIFMAAWQYHDINADFYGFGPQLFVFNVEREPNRIVLEKMSDPEGFLKVHRHVRSQNAKLPRDKRWYFQPFPAIQNDRARTTQHPVADRGARK